MNSVYLECYNTQIKGVCTIFHLSGTAVKQNGSALDVTVTVSSEVHVILKSKVLFCSLCVYHSHMMYLWNTLLFKVSTRLCLALLVSCLISWTGSINHYLICRSFENAPKVYCQ